MTTTGNGTHKFTDKQHNQAPSLLHQVGLECCMFREFEKNRDQAIRRLAEGPEEYVGAETIPVCPRYLRYWQN